MGKITYRLLLEQIFAEWDLSETDRDMLNALGEPAVEHLLAIHHALQQLFAHNSAMAALWPTTPNKGLNGLAPLDLIRLRGLEGVLEVRRFIDLNR